MKTISRIAYSNDKRNRTRSILIMMAICLTTMLLVIISTVGNGVIHLQKSQAAGSYGSNYGLFVSADGSQLKEVNRRAEIDATGTMCTEGIINMTLGWLSMMFNRRGPYCSHSGTRMLSTLSVMYSANLSTSTSGTVSSRSSLDTFR